MLLLNVIYGLRKKLVIQHGALCMTKTATADTVFVCAVS